MICSKCGSDNYEGVTVCINCGNYLKADTIAISDNTKINSNGNKGKTAKILAALSLIFLGTRYILTAISIFIKTSMFLKGHIPIDLFIPIDYFGIFPLYILSLLFAIIAKIIISKKKIKSKLVNISFIIQMLIVFLIETAIILFLLLLLYYDKYFVIQF